MKIWISDCREDLTSDEEGILCMGVHEEKLKRVLVPPYVRRNEADPNRTRGVRMDVLRPALQACSEATGKGSIISSTDIPRKLRVGNLQLVLFPYVRFTNAAGLQ